MKTRTDDQEAGPVPRHELFGVEDDLVEAEADHAGVQHLPPEIGLQERGPAPVVGDLGAIGEGIAGGQHRRPGRYAGAVRAGAVRRDAEAARIVIGFR